MHIMQHFTMEYYYYCSVCDDDGKVVLSGDISARGVVYCSCHAGQIAYASDKYDRGVENEGTKTDDAHELEQMNQV